MDLENKRILLLMPIFYDYHNMVIQELEKKGAIVYFVDNKQLKFNPSSPISKLRWLRVLFFKILSLNWNYLKKNIDFSISYDYLICVNGFTFDKRLIKRLKKRNKNNISILYLWDSLKMYEWKNIELYFDRAFSFDPVDADFLNIQFLPNFYPFIEKNNFNPIIDYFFVGSNHGDRYAIIKKIYPQIDTKNSFIRLLVKNKNSIHCKLLYHLSTLKILQSFDFFNNYKLSYELYEKYISEEFLIYKNIDYRIIKEKMMKSNCIIDLESTKQIGLTHQFMLALALNKKIITTNNYVKNYPFYDKDNIKIIDRENPILLESFLNNTHEINRTDLIIQYRIDNWLNKILQHEII